MQFDQLRAMLALADVSNLSRAAERLHLSTPALFNQIRQLEEELGVRLYERVGRGLQLTDKGRLLAEHARRILEARNQAIEELSAGAASARNVLRLGSGPYSSVHIVPFLLRAVLESCTNVDVRLFVGDDASLIRDLRAGVLDVAFMRTGLEEPSIEEWPLWQYEMVFVLPLPKYGEWRQQVDVATLHDKPFILLKRPHVIEKAIHALCVTNGFSPRTVMEHWDPGCILELVKLGIGYSILPLWIAGMAWKRNELSVLRVQSPSIQSHGLIMRRSGHTPRILADVCDIARRWQEWLPLAEFIQPVDPGT